MTAGRMLAYVDPRDGKPTVIYGASEGAWLKNIDAIDCVFCGDGMNDAFVQPEIGFICRWCYGEVFGNVT